VNINYDKCNNSINKLKICEKSRKAGEMNVWTTGLAVYPCPTYNWSNFQYNLPPGFSRTCLCIWCLCCFSHFILQQNLHTNNKPLSLSRSLRSIKTCIIIKTANKNIGMSLINNSYQELSKAKCRHSKNQKLYTDKFHYLIPKQTQTCIPEVKKKP